MKTLEQQAKEIISYLPGEWRIENKYEHYCKLVNDKIEISLRHDYYKKKLYSSIAAPADGNTCMSIESWNVLPYGETGPECSMAEHRTAKSIAGDIQRKVIIPGVPIWSAILAKKAKQDAAEKARLETIAKVEVILGEKCHNIDRGNVSVYDEQKTYLDVTVGYHDSICVSAKYLKQADALKLANFIKNEILKD